MAGTYCWVTLMLHAPPRGQAYMVYPCWGCHHDTLCSGIYDSDSGLQRVLPLLETLPHPVCGLRCRWPSLCYPPCLPVQDRPGTGRWMATQLDRLKVDGSTIYSHLCLREAVFGVMGGVRPLPGYPSLCLLLYRHNRLQTLR